MSEPLLVADRWPPGIEIGGTDCAMAAVAAAVSTIAIKDALGRARGTAVSR